MTRRKRAASAFTLGMDIWSLSMDSAMVMGMRTIKLAAGGKAAERESRLMVAEKLAAAADLPGVLARSGAKSPEAIAGLAVRHYARKVRANRKRLAGQSAKP